MEFRSWKNDLECFPEHILNKKPIKIDLLVIKKDEGLILNNQIGNIFRTYNIIKSQHTIHVLGATQRQHRAAASTNRPMRALRFVDR